MKRFLCILLSASAICVSNAQSSYHPSVENLAARKWFDSARFGMFIHWGAFSVPGEGEWVDEQQKYNGDRIHPSADHL